MFYNHIFQIYYHYRLYEYEKILNVIKCLMNIKELY